MTTVKLRTGAEENVESPLVIIVVDSLWFRGQKNAACRRYVIRKTVVDEERWDED
jgi:hypothetical protein